MDVLTEAFMDDPVARWLYPDPIERRRLQPRFYGLLLSHPTAEAYLAGRDGAAVWLTIRESLEQGDLGERFRALGAALAGRHPDGRHLYLPCMGVVPGRRGAGLGSALLRDRLDRTDALDAYLEASSPQSRDLYLRHGFEDLGEPVRVDDSPPVWPMVRAAR